MRLFLNGKDLGEHAEFHLLVAVDPAGETIPGASIVVGGGQLRVEAQEVGEAGLSLNYLGLVPSGLNNIQVVTTRKVKDGEFAVYFTGGPEK